MTMNIAPITFPAPLVRAVLDNRKTQHRQPLILQPPADDPPVRQPGIFNPAVVDKRGDERPGPDTWGIYGDTWNLKMRVRPGDLLWVRETWAKRADFHVSGWCAYKAGPDPFDVKNDLCRWRSPVTMPRWASRITLRVTEVRVRGLQGMSCGDAVSEGVIAPVTGASYECRLAMDAFPRLWDSMHAAHPEWQWKADPWVEVLTFEAIRANVGRIAGGPLP